MHSRIFEILPIDYKNDDWQNEIPSWWEEEYADYVDEITDKKGIADSIECFLSDEIVKNKTVTFTKNCLKKNWIKFKESLDKTVESATEDKFMSVDGELSWELYNLKISYNDDGGVWFMDKEGDMYTKMDMERLGGTFKIGRVWDYHF